MAQYMQNNADNLSTITQPLLKTHPLNGEPPLGAQVMEEGKDDTHRAYDLPPELAELQRQAVGFAHRRFYWMVGFLAAAGGAMAAGMLLFLNDEFDDEEQDLALFVGASAAFSSLTSIFAKAIYGPLSDRYGRKWLLVMHYVVETINAMVLAKRPTLNAVCLVILVNALTSTRFLVQAIIVDITSHNTVGLGKKTGRTYAVMGAAAFCVFPVALMLPMETAFAIASFGHLAFAFTLAVAFPETLPLGQYHVRQTNGDVQVVPPQDAQPAAAALAEVPWKKPPPRVLEFTPVNMVQVLRTNKATQLAILAWSLHILQSAGSHTLFVPYVKERFEWGSAAQGIFIFTSATLGILCNANVSVIQKCVAPHTILFLGSLSFVVAGCIFALTFSEWLMYGTLLANVPFGFVFSATMMGFISKEVPKSKQGLLQSAIDCCLALANAAGALAAVGLFFCFTYDERYFPQFPIIVGILCALCSLVVTILAIRSSEGALPGSGEKASIILALGDYEIRKYQHQPPPGAMVVNRAPAPHADDTIGVGDAHKAAYQPYSYERTDPDYKGSQIILKASPRGYSYTSSYSFKPYFRSAAVPKAKHLLMPP